MGFQSALRVGMDGFSKYGKLIGTGKNNGIRVFEKIVDGKKILTSLGKEGNVVKTVTRQEFNPMDLPESIVKKCQGSLGEVGKFKDGKGVITEVENNVNGSTFSNTRVIDTDGHVRYQSMLRTTETKTKDGRTIVDYERFEQNVPHGHHNKYRAGSAQGAEFTYTNRRNWGDGTRDNVTYHQDWNGNVTLDGYRTEGCAQEGKFSVWPSEGKIAFDSNGHIYNKSRILGQYPTSREAKEAYYVDNGVYLRPDNPIKGSTIYVNEPFIYNKDIDQNTAKQLINNMHDFINKLRGVFTIGGKEVEKI